MKKCRYESQMQKLGTFKGKYISNFKNFIKDGGLSFRFLKWGNCFFLLLRVHQFIERTPVFVWSITFSL